MDLDSYEREGRHVYAELARTIAAIIERVSLSQSAFRIQQTQHRAKVVASLRKKLVNRSVAESAAIETDIKDLAGVRVVLYTNADVARFLASDIIGENFEVDWARTKFHYPLKTPTAEEGFISYNYVVRLKDNRLALHEYAHLAGLACEIQVQTTLDHAWSEMAHDTIYKPPAPGFGTAKMKEVADRMTAIIQKYLHPAGFEFQKVADDMRALETARAVAEQNPLGLIANASDNNERYDRIQAFRGIIDFYDDLEGVANEVRRTMVDAIKAGRATPRTDIKAHGMTFEGVILERLVDAALDVIDRLAFLSLEAIDATFAALAELYPGASPEERRRLHGSAERLAKHHIDIWSTAGPLVEQRLVAAVRGLEPSRRLALHELVTEVLQQILKPDLSGQTSTYNSFTFRFGAVVAHDAYLACRRDAIDMLEGMLGDTRDLAILGEILHAFGDAGRLPDHGTVSRDLLQAAYQDSLRIARFMTMRIAQLPYEIRQKYEHDLVWRYRHTTALPPNFRADAELEALRVSLQEGFLAFRDVASTDAHYVTFKTLTGYDSVFEPWWATGGFDIEAEAAYRAAAVEELVATVSEETFDQWVATIGRCTSSPAIEGGGCTYLRLFLKRLGELQPVLLERLFDRPATGLARFMATMLQGLEGGPREASARERIAGWIERRAHLDQIVDYLEVQSALDVATLRAAFGAAVASEDDRTVAAVMGVCAHRYAEAPDPMAKLFLDGVSFVAGRGTYAWVNAVWFRASRTGLVEEGLALEDRRRVLNAMAGIPEIDFHAEELLRTLVEPMPLDLLDFFERRIIADRTKAARRDFAAIPFEFHALAGAFAPIPTETVAAVRRWFEDEPNAAFFEYRGGALIARAFPTFASVEAPLMQLVRRAEGRDHAFVLRVLMAYQGEPVILSICREIIAAQDAENDLVDMADNVLDRMGVIAGEFGFVELHQRRKTEIATWLKDPSPTVRAFAEKRTRRIDLQIAVEQRRALEELEMRKRTHGE